MVVKQSWSTERCRCSTVPTGGLNLPDCRRWPGGVVCQAGTWIGGAQGSADADRRVFVWSAPNQSECPRKALDAVGRGQSWRCRPAWCPGESKRELTAGGDCGKQGTYRIRCFVSGRDRQYTPDERDSRSRLRRSGPSTAKSANALSVSPANQQWVGGRIRSRASSLP